MRTRRLFFACWPDEVTRQALVAGRQRLFPLSGRPVDEANLHLTLAFLGAVEASRVAALSALAGPMAAVEMVLDRLEYWHKPRVVAAAASQLPVGLKQAVDDLWRRLGPLGFVRDPRPFRPHVTLARDVRSLRDGIVWAPLRWRLDHLRLVESVSGEAGVRYVPLRDLMAEHSE